MTALDSQLLAEARRLLASDDELLAGARALLEQDGAQDRYAPVPPGTRARLAPTLTGAGIPPFGVQGLVNGRAPDRFQQEQLDRENAARAVTITGELGSLDAESRRLGMVQDAQIETQAAALLRRDELSGLVDRTLTPLPGEPDAAFTARKMAELNRLAQREGLPTGALPDAFEPKYGGFEAAGRSLVRGGLGVADAFSGQALQYLGSAQQGLTEGITGILDPGAVDIARQLDTPAKRMIEAGWGVSSGFANQQEVFQPSQAVAAQGGLPDSLGQLGGFLLERGPEAIATMAPMVGAGLVGGPGAAMAAGGLLEGLSGFGEAQKAAAEAAANPNLSPVQRRELLARARDEALIERTTYGVIATLLEKLPADQLFAPATVGKIRRIVGTAAAEGGTESLQSASEQIIQNVVGQPTDTTLAQGIEQALGEGLLGIVAGGVVAGGVGGKGGAKRPESVVPDAGRPSGVAQPQAPERPVEAPAAAQQPAGAGPVQPDGGAGVQPEPATADFTDIIEQAAASDLTTDEIAQALPDYLTDAEQESIIAGVEARRTAQPPSTEPPATPSTGISESAAPSPAPEPAPVAPEPQASVSAATEPTAAAETPEGAGSLRDGTRVVGPQESVEDNRPSYEMTESERTAEIARLREAHRTALGVPLASEGGIAPSEIGRMSKRRHERWQRLAQEKMRVQSRIKELQNPEAERQSDERENRKKAESRASSSRSNIADLRRIGMGKSGKVKPSYQRVIDEKLDVIRQAVAKYPDLAEQYADLIGDASAPAQPPAQKPQRPVRRSAPKLTGPVPLTTKSIDDRLVSIARERGLVRDVDQFEAEASGRTGDTVEFSVNFEGKIPDEITGLIDDSPELRAALRPNRKGGGGEDALNALGADGYVAALKQLVGRESQVATDALRDSGDPQIDLLIRARDVRESGEKLSQKSGDKLKPGDSFAIGNESFTVAEGPEGLRLVDGDGAVIEIGPEGSLVDTVPFRNGSYVEGGAEAAAAADQRIADKAEAATESLAFLDLIDRGESSARKAAERLRQRVRERSVPRPNAPFKGRPGSTILIPNLVDTVVAELLEMAANGLALTRAAITARLSKVIDDPKALKQGIKIAERIVEKATKSKGGLIEGTGTFSGPALRKAITAEYKRAKIAELRAKVGGTKRVGRAEVAEQRRNAKRVAAQRLAEIGRRLRTEQSKVVEQGLRDEVVRVVSENLPISERGRFIKSAARVKTIGQLSRLVGRVSDAIIRVDEKRAERRAKSAADAKARREKLSESRRVQREKSRQRLRDLRTKLETQARDAENARAAIRQQVVDLIQKNMPLGLRGKFLSAAAKTKTALGLQRVAMRAWHELVKSEARSALRDIRRRTSPKRMKKLTNDRREQLRKLRDQADATAKQLAEKVTRNEGESFDDFRKRRLAETIDRSRELTDIANRIAEIYAEHANERKVYVDGKAAEVEALVQKATTTDGLSSRKDVKLFDAKGRPVSPKSAWVRIKLPFLNPETVAMMLDGDWGLSSDGNAFRQILVNGLRKAQDARKGGSQAITDKLEGLAKDAGFKSLGDALARISGTLGKASQETVDIEVGGAKKISLGMAMHLYAMDPETRSRFVEQGQQASFDIDGKKRADKFDITTDTFEAVENALTTEQKAFVNGVKAVIESQREALFTVHRNLKGWEPEPQIDYFPIRLNRAAEARTPEVWDKAAVDKWLENAGFLKERAGKSGASILVGDFLSIAIDHLQSANDIIHLAEPIRSAATVLLDNRVQAAVEQKFGRAAKLRVQDIILGASGLKDSFDSLSARVFNRIVGNASKALVSINPMSWGRQAGGLATLKVVMPARVYAAGVAGSTNTGLFKRMMKSPYFRDRYSEHVTARFSDATPEAAIVGVQGTRTILNAGLRAAKNLDLWNALATVPRLTDRIKIVNAFDRLPARVAWAGYEAEVERLHPDWSEKQKFEWVDERASLAMRRSQNTHELIDSSGLASFARAHPWAKMFLAFTSDANKQFNLLVQGWNRGEPGQAIAAIAANAAWGAAMKPAFQLGVGGLATLGYAMLGAEPPEGGEEERNRQLLEGAAWNFVRDVVGIVYGADRVVEFAHYKVGKARAAKNPLFDAPALSVPEDIALSVSQLWDGLETQFFTPLEDFARKQDEALSEPDRKAAAEKRRWDAAVSKYTRAIEGAAVGTAMATGVPMPPLYYAVRREVKRAMNVPNSSQIADAIEAGDTAKAERLAARAVKAAGESSRDRGQAAERLEAGASRVVPDGLSKPEQERWKAKYRAVIVAGYRKSGKAQTDARD